MIQLIRLNGETFFLNALMIEQVEALPDTTITLAGGKKLVVRNSESELTALITDYYQQIGLQAIINKAGGSNE
ncbi:flagellar FlbD family protein [Lentibacillus sediminis]|uniref:flagellar FlbD family protein n=1 Tax=Lentibacillus sediminis TaxID=1940529 RepID=UPI000C1C352C|nr:flagellar FlbD family protein [Lentibacillus sediminis]